MVRPILKQEKVDIPENVILELKSKVITVTGPKGTITKSFRKVPVQIIPIKDKKDKII